MGMPSPKTRTSPLWLRLVAEPRSAADHLATAAVRDLGPAAQQWLERTARRYPEASRHALARLAAYEYGRIGRHRALSAGSVPIIAALAITRRSTSTRAELVLAIAAAYGLDPTDPARAHDLTTLLATPRTRTVIGQAVAAATRVIAGRAVPFGAALLGVAQHAQDTQELADRARTYFRTVYTPGM
jgi:hypothetical protein